MRISRFRPSVAIIGLCYSKELAKKLSLCYAVTPVYLNKKMESINEIKGIVKISRRRINTK
jgi:pyruvate kinase